ncbi:MAG: glycoside hydrolase [Planctomycetota bacterium]|nr:glycoside hydrolase [Planctomycetota bacterium]
MIVRPTALLSALIAILFVATSAQADVSQMQKSFDQPPADARIRVRWWWYGPAVTKPMLEQEMKTMAASGVGGFEVQPTYPLSVDGELPGVHNAKFLSPEFFDDMGFTAAKAKELGLTFDLTLGSGWPYGGPMFSASEGAGRILRQVVRANGNTRSIPAPRLNDGQTYIAAYAAPARNGPVDASLMKEIPIADGAAQLPPEMSGATEVEFFISGRTGMKVKRPAYGAEGFVIDHLSKTVVNKFIKEIAEPEVAACGPNLPHSIFCDSLEVYGEDWTDDLLTEFQKQRGYDLRPLLPALFANVGPKTMEIRHDWGKTLTEVYNASFNQTLHAFAKEHGTLFREQAYGSPSAGEFSYADVDLPEGEGYQWHGYRASRYASSACHLLGVPVSSSETFTWLHSPVFRATPVDMKAEADLHFLQGINQIVCHGWPSTPPGVSYPGWSFYASAVFNQNNPWWIAMPDIAKYLQRVSHIMRQGQPANDVALYLANDDAWANFTPTHISLTDAVGERLGHEIVADILDGGYDLDFFDDGLLDLRGKVDGGALTFGDVKYKVVVLAGVDRIPVSTMEKLESFAKGGGIVVATRSMPSMAPGFQATEQQTQEVRDIAKRLFTDPDATGIFIKDDSEFAAALGKRLAPDVALSPASPQVAAVHRHTDGGEVYFVANTSNLPKDLKATFRIEGLQAEQWDPMTGKVSPLAILDKPQGGETVALNLAPYGSTIIVFTSRTLPAKASLVVSNSTQPLDLSTNWTVTFGKDAQPISMDTLRSWTDDSATRNFSGVATYQKKITVPAEMAKDGIALTMTFGEGKPIEAGGGRSNGYRTFLEPPVRDAAVVYINGKRVGSVWHPPFTLDVTGTLKTGENDVRIEVGNLALNYMAAHKFPNYDLTAIRQQFGDRFQPQDMQDIQTLPAGLLGPIRIVANTDGK